MALLTTGAVVARRYSVIRRLPGGSVTESYLVGQQGTDRHDVLKLLRPGPARHPELVRGFLDQARLATFLVHPSSARIVDLGMDGTLCFVVMEHVDGHSLRKVIGALARRRERMPRTHGLRIAADACRVLEQGHALTDQGGKPLRLIHGDVSLDNIMLGRSGQVKVTDFGIGRVRSLPRFIRDGVVKAPLEYLPPEVLDGRNPDRNTDIYSMGVVLYLLLLGRAPFVAEREEQLVQRIRTEHPPAPRNLDPTLPPALEDILLRALAKDPRDRFANARAMAAELDKAGGHRATDSALARLLATVLPDKKKHRKKKAQRAAQGKRTPLQATSTERDAAPRIRSPFPSLPPGSAPPEDPTEETNADPALMATMPVPRKPGRDED